MNAWNNSMSSPIFSFAIKVIGIWIVFFVVLKLIYIKYKDQFDFDGFLERSNLSVQLFYIGFSTTKLNRIIKYISLRYERFWYYWFKFGSWVSLILLPLSMGLLLYNLFIIFVKPVGVDPIISPIVPGVNVKGTDSWYLIISVVISVIIHEAGHAIASYVSKCEINSVGFFFLFIMPGASVNLDHSELNKTSLWEKLRIQCGGVWHNLILCVIGYLLLSSTTFLLSPLYKFSNNELYITNMPSGSLLERNLMIGDQIVEVNGCKVGNGTELIQCIYEELGKSRSYCTSGQSIACIENVIRSLNNSNNIDLNGDGNVNNKQLIQFAKTPRDCFNVEESSTLIECTPANGDFPLDKCTKSNRECIGFNQFNYHVFTLSIQGQDFKNLEKLVFLGTAQELWESFVVNNYHSRFRFMNDWDLPWYWNHFFSYLIPVSAGLATFNVIAIPNMDGEHILETILSIIFLKSSTSPNKKNNNNNKDNNKTKSIILQVIKTSTIILFGLNVILSFYNLKFR